MFRRFLGLDRPATDPRLPSGDIAAPLPDSAAETATARRIVARLEALPPEEARYLACFAYVMSRAANADLDISDEETAAIERELQAHQAIDEATAVLVTEMAKLQARTVGGPEDFSVTREFKRLASADQKLDVIRACFAIGAANGTISSEETAIVNEIAAELDIDTATLNAIRADFHEQLSSVQLIRRVTRGA
jgi:uncharacterized tellurite resistance protein B-like protein